MKEFNSQVTVAVQIETLNAVETINDILSVPGIDLITFGPQDLAQSMGYPGRPNHPEVLDAMKKVREAVHARGRLMSEDVESGINFVQWVPSKLADWLEEKKSGK